MSALPICDRLRQHGHWADLMRAGDDGADIIEELVGVLERINDTGDDALDINWIRRISRAALAKARGQ